LSSYNESELRSKHAPYMPSAGLENVGQLPGEPEQTTTRLPEARGGHMAKKSEHRSAPVARFSPSTSRPHNS